MEQISFEIILHSGDSKSSAMEALQLACSGKFNQAKIKIEEAQEMLVKAHTIQTKLLVNQSQGKKQEVDLLMVHAQDHLNGALLTIDLVSELIKMYQIMSKGGLL